MTATHHLTGQVEPVLAPLWVPPFETSTATTHEVSWGATVLGHIVCDADGSGCPETWAARPAGAPHRVVAGFASHDYAIAYLLDASGITCASHAQTGTCVHQLPARVHDQVTKQVLGEMAALNPYREYADIANQEQAVRTGLAGLDKPLDQQEIATI